jgi:hypothetical protein
MRILSLRITPFARVLAIIYGAYGIVYVFALLLSNAKQMVFPIGIVAPLVFYSFNLHLAGPTHFLTGVLCAVLAVCCYAITGALTGTLGVLAFNLVAKHTGGIAATWVKDFKPAIDAATSNTLSAPLPAHSAAAGNPAKNP